MEATLDVTRIPQEAIVGPSEDRINLVSVLLGLRTVIEDMAKYKMIKANKSIGFAVAKPNIFMGAWEGWDSPYDSTWFVAGWGPDRSKYIANAVRKLRPLLRTGTDTLTLRIESPDAFWDVVQSVDDDGNFPWGDFPWGGGTFVRVGDLVIPIAVSALLEVEDDAIAKLGGGLVGAEMLKRAMPGEFGPNS